MSNEIDVYNRIVSRWDAWAKQSKTPDKEGRYGYYCQKEPLTRKTIDDSLLSNKATIGAYTVKPVENTVTYPVIDIDNHDELTNVKDDVKRVYEHLVKIGLHPFIEGSGGGIETGAHVCLICKPTPAEEARKVLMSVLFDVERPKHEVFPKQTGVNEDGFGNLVKLPFQFNNRTKARSQILNPETFEPMERQQAIEYLMSLPDSDIHSVYERSTAESAPEQPTFVEGTVKKNDAQNQQNENTIEAFLSNPRIKPCIVKAYRDAWVLHGIGSEGNDFRYASATELITFDATNKTIHEYFQKQSDYDEKVTEGQLRSIRNKGYINATGCKKIKDKCPSLVGNLCESCTYWNKDKPKKEREFKPKKLNTDDVEALKEGLGVYKTIRQLADEAQKVQPILYDEYRNWYLWDKKLKYWKRIDETTIICCIDGLTEENVIDSKVKNEILEAFRVTGRNRQVKPVPKEWLRFNDKVYDLKTKATFEPIHEYFFTAPIPHNLGTSEETPIIDAIFKSWVQNPKDLEELSGYCLVDEYPINRIFFLLGPGGNGKSQYMEFLSRLVGVNNTTATDLITILTSRFEAVKLYRKKIALIGETDYKKIETTDKIKKITGEDWLQGEYKHKDPFDFKNTAKVIISTNDLPESTDRTDAWYRRTIVYEFRNHFDDKGKPIVDTIPEKEYENFCYKILRVLSDLMERGRFTNEGTTQEKMEKYEQLSNPFRSFKEKEIKEDGEAQTPIWVVKESFDVFCVKNGYRKRSEKEFTQVLHDEGYETKRAWWGRKHWATVYGLSLKTPYVYVETEEIRKDENVPDVPDVLRVPHNSLYGKNMGVPSTSGTSGTQTICEYCKMLLNDGSEVEQGPAGMGMVHTACQKKHTPNNFCWENNTPESEKELAERLKKIAR